MQRLIQEEYRGVYSKRPAEKIPLGFAASALNGDHSTSGYTGPEKAYTRFGHEAAPTNRSRMIGSYKRSDGYASLMKTNDDGSNMSLQWHCPDDVRWSQDGEWASLLTNLTTGKRLAWAPFNDTGVDSFLFCDSVNNLSRWSGGVCKANGAHTAGAATLNVSSLTGDNKTNPTDGFAASGTLVIKGDDGARYAVTYSGKTNTSFTGCSGLPAIASGAGVAELPDTSTYSSLPKPIAMFTFQGRLWSMGSVAEPTTIRASAVGDFTSFSTGPNPDDPLLRDFPEGGKNVGGFPIDGWIVVGKENGMLAYQIVYQSGTTRSEAVKWLSNVGLASPRAFALVGDDYMYVTPNGRIRQLSKADAENLFNVDDLGESIEGTTVGFAWDDAVVTYWERRNMVVISCKQSDASPYNDQQIKLDISLDAQGQRTLNFGTMDWYVADMAVHDDLNLYHVSDIQSYCFKSFDGYAKDGAPYRWQRTDRLENFGDPWEQKIVQYYYAYGKLTPGTTVTFVIDYEENGSLGSITKTIAGTDGDPYIIPTPPNVLGLYQRGTEPIGGTLVDLDDLLFFRVIFPLPNEYNPFKIQRTVYTDGIGQRCIIINDGWGYDDPDNDERSDLFK